jgi:hypothetical protein
VRLELLAQDGPNHARLGISRGIGEVKRTLPDLRGPTT